MSKGSSIFSSPNNGSSNGEAPANPFASLAAGSQKSGAAAASPFAAAPAGEPESPFGFAAEESAPEQAKAKLPEKRKQTPMPQGEDNPFLSAGSTPQAESTPSAPAPAASPFSSESTFEAPAKPTPQQEGQGANAAQNPLSAPTPAPVKQEKPQAAPVTPTEQAAPTPAAAAPTPAAAPAAAPAMAAPSPAPTGGQSMRQLELRAIFGSEKEMTRDEILAKAKGLPGIRELTVVGPGETAAVQTIGDVMARFGFGGSGSWQMSCSGGVVDFVSSESATLAVLREGRYSAGVWETLMIVARELGKLS